MTTKSAIVEVTNAGDTEILPAVAGHRIAFRYLVNSDVGGGPTIFGRWRSGGNNITGPMAVSRDGGIASPVWLYTNSGESLVINLSASANVNGHIEYEYQNVS